MIRIAYAAIARIPTPKAHGKQIMEMCAAFTQVGAHCTLIVPKRRNDISDDSFLYYGITTVFPIVRLWSFDLLWLPLVKSVSFVLLSIVFSLRCVIHVMLHRKHYDVVYTRDTGVAFACVMVGLPVVYEAHTMPSSLRVWQRWAYNRCRAVIAISNGLAQDLRQSGVTSRVTVAPDGVDLSRFSNAMTRAQARETLGLSHERLTVVYTGHLYPWKGADLLAQAAQQVRDICDVYIVGGAPSDVAALQSAFSADNLHIIGQRPGAEIPLWLRAADVAVIANRSTSAISSRHTSPLKLFEYMAAGIPIIAADLPALREILTDETAYFFQPDDSSALAECISSVLHALPQAQAKAARAQKQVAQYDWNVRARILSEHFRVEI